MDLGSLVSLPEWVQREGRVIRQAPWTFVFLTTICFGLAYWIFKERTDYYQDQAKIAEDRLGKLRGAISLQEQIQAANAKAARKQKLTAIIKDLNAFLISGKKLLARSVENDQELDHWLHELGVWTGQTMCLLRVFVSKTAETNFRMVTSSETWAGYNEIHKSQKKFLNARLELLTDYIEDLNSELKGMGD